MNTRLVLCISLLVLTLLLGLPLAGSTQQADEETIYARSRDFDQQHVRLELSFDFSQKKVIGQATLRLVPIRNELSEVVLDSIGLTIESVTLAGKPLAFRTTEKELIIALDHPRGPSEAFELSIRYQGQPRRGLFFIAPDDAYPKRPRQIWSQGQANDNRHWFPSYDFPNDKTTSELVVTVPAHWLTVSNGRLLSAKENKQAGTKTWHWLQDKPHSTYLISLVAGEYEMAEEKWKGIPLTYYVPPGTADQIPAAFGRTANMMEFYSNRLGPYPWDKYAQSAVEHFLFGGMENTSATTMARNWIYPAALAPDVQIGRDDGIAHELVHQWFGDLLTCKDWRHSWLNEGFATYFAGLWIEHYYGADEFAARMQRSAEGIARSPAGSRPIVRRPGTESGLIYPKGAWVLHMLRQQLGGEDFWKAIRHYVNKHRFQNVDTDDFLDAVAEATGRNFEWLFDQYVYGAGLPEFDVSWDYDRETRMVHLAVKQTQKVEGKAAPFRLPVRIRVVTDQGAHTHTIRVSKESEDFYFPSDVAPRTVMFDPGNQWLKKLDFKKSAEEWIFQLGLAFEVLPRLEAARALAKAAATPAVYSALEQAGLRDPFFAVRSEVAETLGELKGEQGQKILLAMSEDKEPRVRAAVATALGRFPSNPELLARLDQAARTDTSFTTRAAAIRSLGRLKPADGVDRLRPFLDQDSPHELIRRAAVSALGELGDDKAIPLLLEWTAAGKEDDVRLEGISVLGRLGRGKAEVRDHLVKLLDDPYFRVRGAAVSALRQRREREAVPALEAVARNDWNSFIARSARTAIEEIQKPPAAASPAGEPDLEKLRTRLAELEKENQELRERLKRLEDRLGAAARP